MMRFLLAAVLLAAGAAVGAGCAGSDRAAREAADRDYKRLSGTWQLTRAVVDGNTVPEAQVKATVMITDGNTFRFPQASGVGTHTAGSVNISPRTLRHHGDSVAISGPHSTQVALCRIR